MKPRNNREKNVAKLSKQLGSIGIRDQKNIIKNTYGSCAYDDMYSRCYAVINQAYKGYQVMRYFRITRHRNRQREVSYGVWEVMQLWFKEGESMTFLSRKRTMGMYIDTFTYDSDMEVRTISGVIDLPYDYTYNKSVTGTYQYAAKYSISGISMRQIYDFLSWNKFAETIIALRPDIAKLMIRRGYKADFYFRAVRIAIRHGYNPFANFVDNNTSALWSCYFDMIRALHKAGKDIRNPHYVCPEDFQGMHDWAIDITDGAAKRKRESQELAENVSKYNDSYITRRKRFFDMEITDGLISCKVLRSVKDFYEEGKHMHHCVYKSQYYARPYSIILSAKIDGKRVETVEVDTRTWEVAQAFGACDKFTIYHDRIKDLVNSNMETIKAYNRNKTTELTKIAV